MVIPLGDENPTRRRPYVTWALVALNVAVFFLLTPWQGSVCEQHEFSLRWGAVPAELTQGAPLDTGQLAGTPAARCGIDPMAGKPVYVAVLSAMFLHAGPLHLGGNMLYLWVFGNNVEDRLGRLRFLGFYLGAGVIATVVFVLPNADSAATLVGASGAIAGVLGAYLVMYPRARVTVWVPILVFVITTLPAALVLLLWFVIQLQHLRQPELTGGGVAYLAHASGFVAGAVIALLLGQRPRRPRRR